MQYKIIILNWACNDFKLLCLDAFNQTVTLRLYLNVTDASILAVSISKGTGGHDNNKKYK